MAKWRGNVDAKLDVIMVEVGSFRRDMERMDEQFKMRDTHMT